MSKGAVVLSKRYEVLNKIGAGGMADVYKGKDTMLNRFVAIKILKKEYREDENFVEKFRSEAQAAAGLMHPNIVNVYDVGEDRGLYYMVMELVDGITLKAYIDKKGVLAPREVISVALQICMGLEVAHKHHLIHRDIKPQNIMISKDGKVKVTDFGIARATSAHTVSSNVMGSVHYTSPEQARGGRNDNKSDIYSVGITLYEMCTGELPFDGDTAVSIAIKHLQEDITPPSEYVPDISHSLEQIILKCTMKAADKRYPDVAALMRDLKHSLVEPDGDFVQFEMYPRMGETVSISGEELSKVRQHYSDEEYDDAYEDDDADDYEEEYDEDYDEDDEDSSGKGQVNPRMNKVMKILTISAVVILAFVLLFIIGRAVGLFNFGSGILATQEGVEVPNVIGKTEEDAKKILEDAGFKVQTIGRKPSTQYDEGYVIEQDPEAEKKAKEDTVVRLTVSSGLEGEEITLPDVTGQNEDDAMRILLEAGIEASQIKRSTENHDSVEAGLVIRTTPEGNAQVTNETEIEVWISIGAKKPEKVDVPNVVGQDVEAASTQITNAGLAVGSVTEQTNNAAVGQVLSQSPTSGKVDPGTSINLVISKGPGQVQIPSNLVNGTLSDARRTLTNLGLSVDEKPQDSAQEAGVVLSVSPEQGTSVNVGSTVTVYYSNGSIVEIQEPTTPE